MFRNRVPFKYANLIGATPIIRDGYDTGEYTLAYTEQVEMLGNVGRATGNEFADNFGLNLNYDKIIVLDDPMVDIHETSILWVDDLSSDHHDYIVKRISRSLNSVSIAIEKVQVNV